MMCQVSIQSAAEMTGYYITQVFEFMNDYGSSTSRSRPILKSPNSHNLDDPKTLKRKYEQTKQALKAQKKNSEAMEATIKQLRQQNVKQERELSKKDEQIDILLDQIKYLKGIMSQSKSKKSSKEISSSSYDEQPSTKSTHSQDAPSKKTAVGGYFGSIFN